ncbi:MAG TPA: HAMP domain-containing sensor histidine kinase [Stackebrandtia sp.]|jgi:two-component system OmpR family sensor kinase|uniref:sensor histidine kinase n=1 Tax=Stackebrandtia sp. TaxID=2023065 RepID=UPI002D2B07F4|nr:HAMP domain-containing sensor histidine kinase [Stackebrandtia sp.]HZE39170.1 HAMP domain-containing sensor histidine kinase [Stackebrandtia sp.]
MRRPGFPRTLRARLSIGLVVLLAAACLAVGAATVFALEGFLVERLDQQLSASHGRFPASLEHGEHPDADNAPDTRGQSDGTFGARLLDGHATQAAVVDDDNDHKRVVLSGKDERALASLPTDGDGHTVPLSKLGPYRLFAQAGDDGDVLITGLPMRPVHETVERLVMVEVTLFGAAVVLTGLAGALWVRVSLRPLRRVAATASRVAESPLASGEVEMPDPVPDTDTRTEVGQVGAALNRMLGHVGDALARRHASQERLRRFAADASHEMRTPVATIRAHAEQALRQPEPVPAPVHRALERIQAETQRMTGLVDDLLLLARLDAGRPLAADTVDITRVVLDAIDDARVAGGDHEWQLTLPPEPLITRGDEHRLHQVVANLLANARVHTPPGTTVTVDLAEGDDGIELTVADDGPGIPDALRDTIFDRFARGDHHRARSTGGTGLGLAIAAAVVRAHDGDITVDSRPGLTVFRVVLPRVEEPGSPS